MGYGAPRVKYNPQPLDLEKEQSVKEESPEVKKEEAKDEEEEQSKEPRIPLTFVKKKTKKGDVNKYLEK